MFTKSSEVSLSSLMSRLGLNGLLLSEVVIVQQAEDLSCLRWKPLLEVVFFIFQGLSFILQDFLNIT